MNHYFTVSVLLEGISAQLVNLSALYKLGRSLGYEFVYSPMNWKRSGVPEIYEYLGLDYLYEKTLFDILPDCEIVDFPINDIDHSFDLYTYPAMSDFIRQRVNDAADRSQKPVCARFWLNGNEPRVINDIPTVPRPIPDPRIVPLEPHARAKTKSLNKHDINRWFSGPQNTQFSPAHMRELYRRAREVDPRPSNFGEGKLKLLVHIRQGDTAVIETPWNTYIPTREGGAYQEWEDYADFADESSRLAVPEFCKFLKEIIGAFPKGTFSTIVSSDGFEKGIRDIVFHASGRGKKRIELSQEKIALLEASITGYDAKHFQCFKDIEDCICQIGETPENLLDLIQCALEADVIVFGPQQRFIPKLMAIYAEQGAGPLRIMLETEPRLDKKTGVRNKVILPHHVGSDIGPVLAAVRDRLEAL